MKMKKLIITWLAVGLGIAGVANATIIVGGYSFDDNAFADYVISSAGSYTTTGGSVESSVIGANVDTYAFSHTSGAYLDLGFSDNHLVNGSGYDLALFELGMPDTFGVSVTIGGTTQAYTTINTGYRGGGYNLNVALVDLDDFGIAPGSVLSHVVLGMDINTGGTVPSLAVVGALNSIPEPASMALIGLFTAGIYFKRRFFVG